VGNPKKHGAGDRENACVDADGNCKGHHCDCCKSRRTAHTPERVADIAVHLQFNFIPFAHARGSEALTLSHDRKGAVVSLG